MRLTTLTIGVVALLLFTGCIGSVTKPSDGPATITTENVTMRQNTTTQVHVTAANTSGIVIPLSQELIIDRKNVTFRPSPATVTESFPLQYGWNRQRTIRITIPVNATNRAPGSYRYTIHAGNGTAGTSANGTVEVVAAK